jgi:hypothetical protein
MSEIAGFLATIWNFQIVGLLNSDGGIGYAITR